MAGVKRSRMPSESSSSSSDSSCLSDSHPYATVDIGSDEGLLEGKTKVGTSAGRKSSICSLAVVSLVLSVVCLLAVVACCALYFTFVYNNTTGPAQSFGDERVCMPCVQLSPSPLEESDSPFLRQLESHFDKDDETEMCCASTPAQYAALFKLIVKRQEEVKKLADMLGSGGEEGGDADTHLPADSLGKARAVSAHLLTKPMSTEFLSALTGRKDKPMQQWKSPTESPGSHVRTGLKFHDNKIFVQTQGLYFIYCQILFNRFEGDDQTHSRLASSYVQRHSVLYPATSGILLKSRHTRSSGGDDRHSSFVGGLFFLHPGDQLFVRVSVPQLVSHDDKASFFGLFKVGN